MPKGLGSRRLGVRIEVAMLVFTQFGYWVKSGMTVMDAVNDGDGCRERR